jgi:hypothetical protein
MVKSELLEAASALGPLAALLRSSGFIWASRASQSSGANSERFANACRERRHGMETAVVKGDNPRIEFGNNMEEQQWRLHRCSRAKMVREIKVRARQW